MTTLTEEQDADQRRIAEEAAFADQAYQQLAGHLAMNETFFRKYAQPRDDWDWRQWGAKRLGSIKGCALLDFGCGAGEESIYLAKLGATVTAIDISPVGVRLVNERAAVNNVADRVRGLQMRCDPTEFPDSSFDVIHGFGILHHIGLRKGLLEAKRLLRPGGRGLFFEHMGNSQLIERIRPKEGHYTEGERPVTWEEVQAMSSEFAVLDMKAFHIVHRLRHTISACGSDIVKRFDHSLLKAFPPLRFVASGLVIYLERP